MSVSAALHRTVTGHTAALPLAVVRILVGGAAIAKAFDVRRALTGVLEPTSLRVPYLDWLPDIPPTAVPVLLAVWIVAAAALAVGWRTPLAGGVLTVVLAYVLLLDQQLYGNNHYLLTLVVFLLTIADSGARASFDARRRGPRNVVAAWPVQLLKFQLSVVYGFAAITKFNVTFLSGSILASLSGAIAIPEAWRIQSVMLPLALAAILVEVFLALALWSPRLRGAALALGVAFHTSIVLTAGSVVELTIFSTVILALYVLFFDFPQSFLERRGTAAAGIAAEDGRASAESLVGVPSGYP